MNQSTVPQEELFDNEQNAAIADKSSGATASPGYARLLRILGLILEQHRFATFDLRVEEDICVVKGIVQRAKANHPSVLEHIRDLLCGSSGYSGAKGTAISKELSLSLAEIVSTETKVQEQRQEAGKIPDPYCMSQILRGVGCYLDNRIGSGLIGVTIKDRWVTIVYRTADGRLERTHQDYEYFYNYSVKMYMHRSSREPLPPLSDPTLIVTWEDSHKRHQLSHLTK